MPAFHSYSVGVDENDSEGRKKTAGGGGGKASHRDRGLPNTGQANISAAVAEKHFAIAARIKRIILVIVTAARGQHNT